MVTRTGAFQGKEMENDIVIGVPSVSFETDDVLTVSYPIASEIFPRELVFKIGAEGEDFIDRSLNCALVALIIPAMRNGSRIILNGPVSEKLLFSCQGKLQFIVNRMLDYETVPIIPNGSVICDSAFKPKSTATGFSGGVDSYSILNEHYFKRDQSQSSINYLVFNNIGANGATSERALFEKRLKDAKKGASAVGLPLIVVDSNMDDYYRIFPDLHFFKTHSFRNASVAHLLSNTISNYFYAAARTYSEVRVEPSETIGNVDPITLPLLSSESLDIQSEGASYSRSQKIVDIVDLKIVQKNLHVCVDHNHENGNCSICQKCVRTLMVIELLGRLNDFGYVFDLEKYFVHKKRNLDKILTKNDSFSVDIKRMMVKSDEKIPLYIRLKVAFLIKYKALKTIVKNMQRSRLG